MESTWILTLPNAIRMTDGQWTKEVELSEMVGEDEDILADQTREQGGKGTFRKSGSMRITEILSRCTVRVGTETRPDGKDRFALPDYFKPVWSQAFSSDRAFAMVRLRQLTLGNDYVFSESCPECGKMIQVIKVKLDELDVKDMPLDVVGRDAHEVTLPRSGDVVRWRFLRGVDEDAVEEVVRTMKSDFITGIMHRRLVSVNREEKVPGGLNYLKRMSAADRRFLAGHFDVSEGGIDTDIQIVCDSCNREFSKKLSVMGKTDFFFPSATPSTQS